MRDRLGLIDGTETGKCEIPPGAVAFYPVKRRVPTLFVQSHPAERQPEFRAVVAVVLDERDVFAVCDRSCCQRKGGNKCLMPRPFVVIDESVALIAYGSDSFFEINELVGTPRDRGCRPFLGAHGVTRPTSPENWI